jgi:hypothetical protein
MTWYPQMRAELAETLRILTDVNHQRRVWVEHELLDEMQYDNFDHAVHFLYAWRGRGRLRRGRRRASKDRRRNQDSGSPIAAHGKNLRDEEYLACPEWQGVLESARVA